MLLEKDTVTIKLAPTRTQAKYTSQEKEQKLAFLSKVIKFTGLCHNEQDIGVSAKSIVAGLEPEKTNYFLQKFGQAVEMRDSIPLVNIIARLNGQPEPARRKC